MTAGILKFICWPADLTEFDRLEESEKYTQYYLFLRQFGDFDSLKPKFSSGRLYFSVADNIF